MPHYIQSFDPQLVGQEGYHIVARMSSMHRVHTASQAKKGSIFRSSLSMHSVHEILHTNASSSRGTSSLRSTNSIDSPLDTFTMHPYAFKLFKSFVYS